MAIGPIGLMLVILSVRKVTINNGPDPSIDFVTIQNQNLVVSIVSLKKELEMCHLLFVSLSMAIGQTLETGHPALNLLRNGFKVPKGIVPIQNMEEFVPQMSLVEVK